MQPVIELGDLDFETELTELTYVVSDIVIARYVRIKTQMHLLTDPVDQPFLLETRDKLHYLTCLVGSVLRAILRGCFGTPIVIEQFDRELSP